MFFRIATSSHLVKVEVFSLDFFAFLSRAPLQAWLALRLASLEVVRVVLGQRHSLRRLFLTALRLLSGSWRDGLVETLEMNQSSC